MDADGAYQPMPNRADNSPSDNEVQPVASPTVRALLIAGGSVFTAVGFVGVVLPVLPTTPFLLLAAFCYARSSQRLYEWLLDTRGFGPLIRQYRDHRTIPTKAKAIAVTMIAVTIGLSAAFAIPLVPVKVLVVVIGLAVSGWILSHPSSADMQTE
jgi:uncharacterized membrane protein YbaN (DUF454 family)